MPFNFPDPAVSTTATNPVTGAKYQWRADPGKWVLTGGPAEAPNPPVTISLLPPEGPQKGDLWIHEETLIEYAWDGTQWFEVGSSCGGDTKEEEEVEELYHPFVNSFKLVAPDYFNGKKGTATILTTAYDAGDDSYISPTVQSVRFAAVDLNDRKLELAIEGDTIQLTPDNQSENGDKTLYGELEVTTVTVGSSSTTYDVDFDINRSVIYTEGDIVHYRIATVEEPPYQPFIGRYKLVAPDDYTGEDGTATIKTLAYFAGSDTFFSPDVQEAYFASVDLDGRQHDSVSIGETFDLAPQTLSSNTKSYGTYSVTGTPNFNAYTVETQSYVLFTEGGIVYFRKATSDQYVRKVGGDTMEGQLIINGPRREGDDVDNPKLVSSLKVLNIDNAQNSALQLRHSGNAKIYIGDTDVSVASDIKFNRNQPSIVKSGVQDLLLISNEEIAYLGKSIEDDDLVTKKYVDEVDEELRQDIIELEQEIDSIAPSVERGEWQYINTGLSTNAGSYSMNTDTLVNGLGDPANIFAAVENIVINEKDKAGTIHSFANVEVGQLLEIFEASDADYGLYEILDVTEQLGGGVGAVPAYTYWSFDVALVRTGQGDTASGLARFKIFSPPEGGTADGFVLKSGDTMTGTLEIKLDGEAKLSLQGKQGDANRSSGTIQFNNQNVNQTGFLTYYTYGTSHYFRFNRDLELSTKLRTNEITTRSGDSLVFDKKMDYTNTSSVNARFRRGIVIKKQGATIDGDNIFSAYNDEVLYVGPINTDDHIVNKKYVDDQIASLATDPGETVTETIENLLDFNRESILVTNIIPLNLSHVTDYAPTSTVYGYFIAKSRFNRAINENISMKDGWVASKNGTMYARMYDGSGGSGGTARKLQINQVEEKTLDGVEGYYFKFSGFRPAGNNHGDFSLSGIKVTGQKGKKLTIGTADTTTPRTEYVFNYSSYKGGASLVHDNSTTLFIPINWIHRTYGFVPLGMKDRTSPLSIGFKIGNNSYLGSVDFSSVSTSGGYYGYSVTLSRSVSAYSPWNIIEFTISGITYDHVIEDTSGEFTVF